MQEILILPHSQSIILRPGSSGLLADIATYGVRRTARQVSQLQNAIVLSRRYTLLYCEGEQLFVMNSSYDSSNWSQPLP